MISMADQPSLQSLLIPSVYMLLTISAQGMIHKSLVLLKFDTPSAETPGNEKLFL